MEKQEKSSKEDALGLEEKKNTGHLEAGRTRNGEPSAEALKSWFIWAGAALVICLAVALAGAFLSSGKNKKETSVLQLDAGPSVELGLNRKGVILRAEAMNESGASLLSGLQMDHMGLSEGIELLLGRLSDSGKPGDERAILLTVQKCDEEDNINIARMTEQAVLYTENALNKYQSGAFVYVGTIQQKPEIQELTGQYGITAGKAGFVKNLVDKNTKLRLEDTGRLARMEIKEIASEISRNKYSTSFELVTVKTSYGEKESREETLEESTEETSEESTGESAESVPESTEASQSSEAETRKEVKATAAPQTEGTKATETAGETTAAPSSASPEPSGETAATETPASPETSAPAPETESFAPETSPSPETQAPTQAPQTEDAPVNPKGPGFEAEDTQGVKSPLEGPGA